MKIYKLSLLLFSCCHVQLFYFSANLPPVNLAPLGDCYAVEQGVRMDQVDKWISLTKIWDRQFDTTLLMTVI